MIRPESLPWDHPSRLEQVAADVEILERHLSRRRFDGVRLETLEVPRVIYPDELTPAEKEEWASLLREEAARDRREWGMAS